MNEPRGGVGSVASAMGDLLETLRARPPELVPFREIEQRLELAHMIDRGVQEVPLEAVVGSLNRTRDFDRAFLPRDDSLRQHLRRMRELVEAEGYRPVDLYQVGGAYFVVDGHHRISVARTLGAGTVEAHVWEFPTDVDVEPGDSLDAMLTKAAALNFERVTGLPATGDGAFTLTSPAGHDRLLEHIAVHQYYLGTMYGRSYSWPEAVASWRDTVYEPVVEVIRARRLLDEFPDRTETDLYLWIVDRLHRLRREYADHRLGPEAAMPEPGRWRRWLRRLGRFFGRGQR